MSGGARDWSRLWAAALLGGSVACNFEVPSASYLRETTLITVLVEVTELGELNPGRVGPPSPAPITEAMPGDRIALDAYVVDVDGLRVPADELDSLWFSCGVFGCGGSNGNGTDLSSDQFDRDCADLDGTDDDLALPDLDAVCRLGSGDGRFELEVLPLGPLMVEQRVAQFYGVIAWEGRSAADCWAARRKRDRSLERCGFIQRSVKIGPSWWMLAYADALGLPSSIPIPQIPIATYAQPANRVPLVELDVAVGGEVIGRWPDNQSFAVRAGDRVTIEPFYDETSQLLQSYAVGLAIDEERTRYVFTTAVETTGERVFSSNALLVVEYDPSLNGILFPERWEVVVDEYAASGTSRVVLHYFDDRYGEGVATLVFEVTGS